MSAEPSPKVSVPELCNNEVPVSQNLLQNSAVIPEENPVFATPMGPPAGVFVAKMPAGDLAIPQLQIKILLEAMFPGGSEEVLTVQAKAEVGVKLDGRGRPAALNEYARQKICLLLMLGHSRSLAAADVNVARSTITRTMQRDPVFCQQVLRSEELFAQMPLLTIMQAAQKNWRAAAWLMKHHQPHEAIERRKQRKQEKQQQEHMDRFFNGPDSASSAKASSKGPRPSKPR